MFLRNAIGATILLAGGTSTALAEKAQPTLEMTAISEVQIAPDGHVKDYVLKSQLTPTVASVVDRDVRGWRFEPILVDGVPVVAKTTMHIKLLAEPKDQQNYALRITGVQFGEPKRSAGMKPPRYPKEAISSHVGAKVMLCVRLDDAGNVVEAHAYQTSLDVRAPRESEAEHFRRLFEQASLAAANTWHYDLAETINGKPIGTTAMIPVVFSLHNFGERAPADDQWKAYLPGPIHPAPWVKDDHLADNRDLTALPEGQALSLDTHFRLKENVVGKTL